MSGTGSCFSFTRAAAAGAFTCALVACDLTTPPELLAVHRLDPSRVSGGSRITVTGEGFPAGRPATLTFRGNLYRPGAAPEHGVRIVARAAPGDRDAVVVLLDPALERRFVGSGPGRVHTTFRGDIRVAFEPAGGGLAAIAGTARQVRLDVLPATLPPPDQDHPDPGVAALAFLGMTLRSDPGARGLRVDHVEPMGRASLAGISGGDLLTELDSVSLLSPGDLQVPSGRRGARVGLERGGRPLTVDLDVAGLAPVGPEALVGPGAALLVACLLVLVPGAQTGIVLRWLLRLGEIGRGSVRSGRSRSFLPGALFPQKDGGVLRPAAWLILGAVLVGGVRLAVGRSLLSPEFDLAALVLGVSGALLATRLLDGGFRGVGGWSPTRALVAGAQTAVCVFPALFAILGAVVASGRFVIAEMVADQGAAPWRWAAARNPGLALLAIILMVSVVPERGDRSLPAEGLAVTAPGRSPTATALVRLAEWSALWTFSALAVALFLGGWRLPLVSSLTQESSRALSWVGAGLFLGKVSLAVLATGALRALTGRLFIEHVAALALRWMLPGSVLGLVLAASWATLLDGARSQLAADLFGYATVGLVLASGLATLALRRAPGPLATASVNPWL